MLLDENIDNINKHTFTNHFCNRNICFTNKMRIHINQLIMHKVVNKKKDETPLCLNKLVYDNNSQDVILTNDTPIIARIKAKQYDICNNDMFIIKISHLNLL